MTPIKENRCRLARENAGLSVGQAAKMLDVHRAQIESRECSVSPIRDVTVERMAELYGVNVEWMLGECERYDYKAIDKMVLCDLGPDGLSPRDRDTLAEFAASLPRKAPKTLDQIRAERSK